MKYTTKSAFKIDTNLIYNLRHYGWEKGEQSFQNDLSINLEARHLTEDQRQDIMKTIVDALDSKFLT